MAKRSQRARQYTVRDMPIIDVEDTPIDLSYQDNDDGTITASFDSIPGAYIDADTLALCGAFLERVIGIVKQQVISDIRVAQKREDGGKFGQTSLASLEKRGLQTRLIDGYYCTRLLGTPKVMFTCRDTDALGSLLSLLIQCAMASYRADRQRMH